MLELATILNIFFMPEIESNKIIIDEMIIWGVFFKSINIKLIDSKMIRIIGIKKGNIDRRKQIVFEFTPRHLWIFALDGVICKEEMCKVTEAIHELMGTEHNQNNIAHVNKIFDTMDTNNDGKVTLEEFINYCNTNQSVRDSMSYLP